MAVCIKPDRIHIDGQTTAPNEADVEAGDIYYNTEDDVLYRYDQNNEWVPVGGGAIFVQETEPDVSRGVNVAGMLWLDTGVSAALRVWDGYSWIEIFDPEASNRAIARNTAPSNPVTGDSWLNTVDGILYVWNNSWVPVTKSIDSYDELADLTDVTNASTAPAGHILQANGDGTFTFVDSTPSLLDLTDITNAASSTSGQILQSNSGGTTYSFVTPITTLAGLENVTGNNTAGHILVKNGGTGSNTTYQFISHTHTLEDLTDIDISAVPGSDDGYTYILTADGDGTYSFQKERSASAWYSVTPPNNPFTGELWYFPSDTGRAGLYVWNGDAWVETWGGFQEIDLTPTVTINSSITTLPETNSGNFTIDAQYDADSVIDLVILSGGGSLSTTTPAPGGSVTYTPANVSASTTVEIEATVINSLGETATDTITFTVTDTPAPTIAITGSTADIAYGGNRTFTVSSTNDVDGLIAISITSGGGTLSSTSVGTSSSFIYTPGTYSGSVTISAVAVNYDNESAVAIITVNALPDTTLATGGSTINGQTALQEIRTSDYISSGGVFEIPSNYWIWSDNTSVAALIIDTPNATVINNGKIIGKGGRGGNGEQNGSAGGPAIQVTASGVTISNASGAYIAGGGGGGGGGKGGQGNGGGGGGAGGGAGGNSSGVVRAGGSGGVIGAVGGYPQYIAAGSLYIESGAGGSGGLTTAYDDYKGYGGWGGGRQLPGAGGWYNQYDSTKPGKGGDAGSAGTGGGQLAGTSRHANGGGGWGAAGGSSSRTSGGAGGAAVSGTYTQGTWSGTVYGSS